MQDFLNQRFLNNTLLTYLLFFLSLTTSIIIATFLKHFFLRHLHDWFKNKTTSLDESMEKVIKRYFLPIIYFGIFYINIKILYLNSTLNKVFDIITLAFMTIMGAILSSAVIIYLFNKYWEKRNGNTGKFSVKWIATVIKVLVWIAALLLFLENIGIQVTALIAGLGIGGIAVAFAAQAILEDVFSFITIFFDRPFEIDDFITIEDYMGTVEHIGIKTTRLRSLSGEQLIFSNKDLTSSRLKNYKTLKNRRVLFTIKVTYDTVLGKLKNIPELMKKIIDTVPDSTFDRAHFSAYGEYGLEFEIAYYVLSDDYVKYMDIHQQINYLIKEEFEKEGIAFALPTQTIRINSSTHKVNSIS